MHHKFKSEDLTEESLEKALKNIIEKSYRVIKYRVWDGNRMTDRFENPVIDKNKMRPLQVFRVEMLATGIKDKNGKEIYDGDILHIDSSNDYSACLATVKFGECDSGGGGFVGFYLDRHKYELRWPLVNNKNDIERSKIIGNIYENPELLK